MSGWKTIVFAAATTLLGILQSVGVTDFVAAHPGAVTTVVGVVIALLRVITTTPIFKGE